MDYLAKKFLTGVPMKWYEMKKLYRHYKNYCHTLGIGVLDLSVVDELIEWETAFATGSILLRSGEKPEPSDEEVFNTAELVGEMEYWFYRLREQDRTLSNVWLMAVMNREKSIDIAEKLGLIAADDGPDKIYYIEHSQIPNMLKRAARAIVKIRLRTLQLLTKRTTMC
ncbi:hypothetical protein [Mesoaciditoga lauensis]|uniref:hypothetical protein n=1 Tax=Mesoaciditoga lauensis TaxID=1495039 RepID=UPI00056C0610|nr:hypothetical protein [Mesoaciditoga lauensis]